MLFAFGLMAGGGLVLAGFLLGNKSRVPAPLQLVPRSNSGTDAVTAEIPPSNLSYAPVYLTDSQIASMERMQSGSDGAPAHGPLEAERR